MKRNEFIRLSILASLGLAAAPAIKLVEKLPPLKTRQFVMLKVTHELVNNREMFNEAIRHLVKGGGGNLVNMDIGYMNDDFVKNLFTVRLELE